MVDVSPEEFCSRLAQQFANPEEGRRARLACSRVFVELRAETNRGGPRPAPRIPYPSSAPYGRYT